MKLKLFLAVLFLFSAFTSYADEIRDVVLQSSRSEEVIKMGFANIFVTRNDVDDNTAELSVEVENLDETNLVLFFGRSFSENELKKMTPKITYDKYFGGTKGQRVIDTFANYRNFVLVNSSEKFKAIDDNMKIGDKREIRLPMYVAKYKDRKQKKVILLQKVVLQLNIEFKIDEQIIQLNNAYNEFIEVLDTLKFCTNKNHVPKKDVNEQKKPYLDRINEFIAEIDGIISANHWSDSDREYQKYHALRDKFSEIDLSKCEIDSCDKDKRIPPPPQHKCKYDNLSLQQIFHMLDDYYIKIYSKRGDERKALKDRVMADVELLYRCCTDTRCRQHASAWRQGGEYKDRIIDRYNRIKNF